MLSVRNARQFSNLHSSASFQRAAPSIVGTNLVIPYENEVLPKTKFSSAKNRGSFRLKRSFSRPIPRMTQPKRDLSPYEKLTRRPNQGSRNMIKRGFSRLKACARVKVRSQRRRSGKTSFSNVGALKAISFEALCNVRDRSSAHKSQAHRAAPRLKVKSSGRRARFVCSNELTGKNEVFPGALLQSPQTFRPDGKRR